MLEDLINSMVDFLVPSEEDISNIEKKLDNKQDLDSYDIIVLQKIKIINHIIKSKGEKI